jgi:hypothetical protein
VTFDCVEKLISNVRFACISLVQIMLKGRGDSHAARRKSESSSDDQQIERIHGYDGIEL